ncbi:molecular chaperone GrpE (heat shock protein) [Belliella baltica DSM 15883]|uniref:Protein GrpE n=1 Tax=Belliella baltica (strain DSM 15883 / CIP 108006 / LMG 21964 / BA134) TaxID=866536 RepID=I3Z1L5_BELBD|nr:nucleotide exchange factor GrpE [Belliella baltica]AFL83133.1 molecular chaperone GrpE (heat shock protein) [Belliella baltica DSM 15883]
MSKENITSEAEELNKEEVTAKEENTDNTTEEVVNEVSEEEKLKAEVQELKDKYLRLYSEFENYRRRTSKERLDLIKTASQDLMTEIIPVVDDFERAFKASENEEDATKVRDGNQLVFQKFQRILENKGLKPMEGLVGESFDAETQEAITQIPAPNEELKGKVIDVVEKGYTLGDKVVRYAKVVIGA